MKKIKTDFIFKVKQFFKNASYSFAKNDIRV